MPVIRAEVVDARVQVPLRTLALDLPTTREGGGTVEVTTSFRGVAIACRQLRPRARRGRGSRREDAFLIGSARGVHAPADVALLGGDRHALALVNDRGLTLSLTPGMRGEVVHDAGAFPLELLDGLAAPLATVPPGARLRIACGETTFVLSPATAARALPRPRGRWRREPLYRYIAGAAALLLACVALLRAFPRDLRALAVDWSADASRVVTVAIVPPFLPVSKVGAGTSAPGTQAGATPAAHRPRRKAGRVVAGATTRGTPALAMPAPNRAGMLAVLGNSATFATIAESGGLLDDAEAILAGLTGSSEGTEYGVPGGIGVTGTGARGAGTGDRTIGTGTLGVPGRGGPGLRRGDSLAGLPGRRIREPAVVGSLASVQGALDREIVRRVVRLHVNEVKFCYESVLAASPALGGRVVVDFVIGGQGAVMAAVIAEGVGHARLESCVAQAVRRWTFPRPDGGGVVRVRYPFVFTPAGGR